jgi:hypothetical protein
MTFSLGEAISNIKSGAIESNFLKSIATNPFYAALVIVFIIMFIILITFRHCKLPPGDTLWSVLLRTGIYSYGAILVIMYCHNYYMEQTYKGAGETAPNIAGNITLEDFSLENNEDKPEVEEPLSVPVDKDGLPSFV